MPLDTFAPPHNPSISSSKDVKSRTLRANFGDGYSQRAGDGLNIIIRSYNIVLEALTASEADTIEDFFEDHAGGTAFLYTFPGEATERQFICDKWTRNSSTGGVMFTISASFEEVFDL